MSPEAVFGKVVERELAKDVAKSSDARALFVWTRDMDAFAKGGRSSPGDFVGTGRAQGDLFEITSIGGVAEHAARWNGQLGELVHMATYTYPL